MITPDKVIEIIAEGTVQNLAVVFNEEIANTIANAFLIEDLIIMQPVRNG